MAPAPARHHQVPADEKYSQFLANVVKEQKEASANFASPAGKAGGKKRARQDDDDEDDESVGH